jgi:hypothetical protein
MTIHSEDNWWMEDVHQVERWFHKLGNLVVESQEIEPDQDI